MYEMSTIWMKASVGDILYVVFLGVLAQNVVQQYPSFNVEPSKASDSQIYPKRSRNTTTATQPVNEFVMHPVNDILQPKSIITAERVSWVTIGGYDCFTWH